jgi:hypothetical protein
MCWFECLPIAEAERKLAEALTLWLQHPPEFEVGRCQFLEKFDLSLNSQIVATAGESLFGRKEPSARSVANSATPLSVKSAVIEFWSVVFGSNDP